MQLVWVCKINSKFSLFKKIIKKKPSLIRIKSSNIISDVRRPSYSALDNCKFLKLYKIKLNRIEDNISECLDNYWLSKFEKLFIFKFIT